MQEELFEWNLKFLDKSLAAKVRKCDGMVLKDFGGQFFPTKGASVVIILGFGVHCILSYLGVAEEIVVIELSLPFFKSTLQRSNLISILTSKNVKLLIDEPYEKIERVFKELISVDKLGKVEVVEFKPSTSLSPKEYERVKRILEDTLTKKRLNLATSFEFGEIWLRNILLNLPAVVKHPPVGSLFGKFDCCPAIVVGAGPSLDKNIDGLKEVKGKALLIAVDSALKSLLDRGIRPHFVVCVDAGVENYERIRGVDGGGIALVADPVVQPETFSCLRGPIFITSHGHPLVSWILKYLGREPSNFILRGGGSVSTIAFDLARKVGGNPIIFVGQDFSFPDSKLYAQGVEDEDYLETLSKFRTIEMIQREALMNIDGVFCRDIYGVEVFTSKKLLAIARWLEEEIKRTDALCINATEGGILREGVKMMRLDEAIRRYCKAELDVESVLFQVSQPEKPKVDELINGLMNLGERFGEVKRLCKEGLSTLNEGGGFDDLQKINKKIFELKVIELLEDKLNELLFKMSLREDTGKIRFLYEELYQVSQRMQDLLHTAIDVKWT